ncbi:hypothetical protein C0J52_26821 [Blattella germanica]|nr:hypothetical protein C0J52_26821 [Blattella germanica]
MKKLNLMMVLDLFAHNYSLNILAEDMEMEHHQLEEIRVLYQNGRPVSIDKIYRTRIASSSSFLRRASLDLLAASLFFRRFTQYSSLLPSLPASLTSGEESSAADSSGLKELLPPF